MPDPRVYIVILNYRQWQDTIECLESVLTSLYDNFSVVIIDNHSGNNSLENIAGWLQARNDKVPGVRVDFTLLNRSQLIESGDMPVLSKVTLIQNDENAGFAAGNNVVLRLLRTMDAYIWLLNPDMIVNTDTLPELVGFAKERPINSITGAVVYSNSGNRDLLFYGGGIVNFLFVTVVMIRSPDDISKIDYIAGSCLFTHASNFKKCGLLPEDYFLYWEETDWCYQARQAGYDLNVCSTAICYDKISTVIGKTFIADYYYVRNGLLFVSKFSRTYNIASLFFIGLRFIKRIISGRWDRARGVWKGTADYFKAKRNEAK